MDTHAGQPTDSPLQPLLSVIVPVYNVEPYLHRCLDSICGQSYRNLEIICVDDGSTDGSLAILRAYEAKDSRVRVVTQPNSRQARARNVALDMARGEWVIGADSDDYLLPDAYAKAMAHVSPEVDLVCFGVRVEAAPGSGLEGCVEDVHRFANCRYVGVREMDMACIRRVSWLVYNKLYRRSLIEEHGLRFDVENCGSEDLCFHLRYCAYVRKADFLPDELYVYALRPGSTCYSDSQAALRVRSYLRCVDNVLGVYRDSRGLAASVPLVEHVLSLVLKDASVWTFRCGQALEFRRQLLQLAAKYGLQEFPALAPLLHELGEQLCWAQRAVDVLRALAPAVDSVGDASAEAAQHVAVPVDGAHAGVALELLWGLRESHAPERPLCVHVVCAGLCPADCARMEALSTGTYVVRVHAVELQALCVLPPLAATGPYLPYLKMALPWLLPSVGRVVVLAPGLALEGALPDVEALPMGENPVGVPEGYAPSSVLVMELARLRAEQGVESWVAACLFHPRCLPEAEVASLSQAFEGRVACLPAQGWPALRPADAGAGFRVSAEGGLWVGLPLDAGRAQSWSPFALPVEQLLVMRGYIRRCYWLSRLLAAVSGGRRRRRCQERALLCRQLLARVRAFEEEARRRLPC